MSSAANRANPFPGLRPFNHDEVDLFFGRDAQSDELVRRLASRRLLAVVGSSGSGKSSLVRAGLLPALEGGLLATAGSRWRLAILRPQDDPIGSLALAIANTGALAALGLQADAAASVLETTLRRSGLGLVEATRLARLDPHENLLVLVDQFEELFRFASLAHGRPAADDAPAFVKLLLEAARQTELPIYVVLTMRSDFLGDCTRFRDLPEAISDSQYLIPRLTRDALQDAISCPIAVRGGRIAPALVQHLLNAVGDDMDQLPVLQHALMRAWDHWADADRPLDLADLDAVGGLVHALSWHADEAYQALASDGDRRIAQRLFQCLSEREPSNREVRRPTRLTQIAAVAGTQVADVLRVVEVFRAPGRSFLMPPLPTPLDGDSVIDISHESLIRQWARLCAWVDEEAASRASYLRLVDAATLHGAGKGSLWREPDLSGARQWQVQEAPNPAWAQRYSPGLAPALAFLQASEAACAAELQHQQQQAAAELAALEREQQQAQRLTDAELQRAQLMAEAERQRAEALAQRAQVQDEARMRQRKVMAGLWAALLLAVGLGVWGWQQSHVATQARIHAEAARLASLSAGRLADDPELGGLIALKALDSVGPLAAADADDLADALSRALSVSRVRASVTVGAGKTPLRLVAYSADGAVLATQGEGHTIVLRNGDTGQPSGTPIDLPDEVAAISFAPVPVTLDGAADAQDLLAVAAGNTVQLRRLDSPAPVRQLVHAAPVLTLAFSADGLRLTTAQKDGLLQVWDVRTGQLLPKLPKLQHEYAQSLSLSPDGQRLASAGTDNTVAVWDLRTGKQPITPLKLADQALVVRYSPDGQWLAAAGKDNLVHLWDAATGVKRHTLYGHVNTVFDLAFSPDSKRLVTASADTTVRLHDVASGRPLWTLAGHGKPVEGIAFSPDKVRIATTGWDGTVKLWDVRGLLDSVSLHAFSQNGERLLTANPDGTAPLWDANTGDTLLYGSIHQVTSIALGDDGSAIATGSADGSATLWAASGKRTRDFVGRSDESVIGLAISQNGQSLATVSASDARVWDVASGKSLLKVRQDYVFGSAVAFSPDAQSVVTADLAGNIVLWTVAGGARHDLLKAGMSGGGSVNTLVFSRNGQWLVASTADGQVKLWQLRQPGAAPRTLVQGGYVFDVSFSPAGDRLVSSGMDGSAKIWDLAAPDKPPVVLHGHTAAVASARFNHDGTRVVTGSWDRTVRVWDSRTGQPLAKLLHGSQVKDAMFNHDSSRLTSLTMDGTVRVHLFDIDRLKAMARQRLTRSLTADECASYFPGLACP